MSELLITTDLAVSSPPHPELTGSDVLDYVTDLVAARRQANPDYGKLPDNHRGFDERQHRLMYWVFDHFAGIAIINEEKPTLIDTFGLKRRIGFTDEDIQDFMAANILEPDTTVEPTEGTLERPFRLTQPYEDFRWAVAIDRRMRKLKK